MGSPAQDAAFEGGAQFATLGSASCRKSVGGLRQEAMVLARAASLSPDDENMPYCLAAPEVLPDGTQPMIRL
jgi:hypothetical protein